MPFTFSEVLTGGIAPDTEPFAIQPLALELVLTGRNAWEVLFGAPLEVAGTFRAPESPVGGLVREGVLWGTLRFLPTRGMFYDLRLGAGRGADPRDVASLQGARRFRRGDLWRSATTFDGELCFRGDRVGEARLRFDARDDLPVLVRSFRAGG